MKANVKHRSNGLQFPINSKCNTSDRGQTSDGRTDCDAGHAGDSGPGGGDLALVPVELRGGLLAEVCHPAQGPVLGPGEGGLVWCLKLIKVLSKDVINCQPAECRQGGECCREGMRRMSEYLQ